MERRRLYILFQQAMGVCLMNKHVYASIVLILVALTSGCGTISKGFKDTATLYKIGFSGLNIAPTYVSNTTAALTKKALFRARKPIAREVRITFLTVTTSNGKN